MKMNIAIITGASSGIGMELARQIDGRLAKTDEIWLLARRKEPLEAAAAHMHIKTRVIPIDLTCEKELRRFSEVLDISRPKITVLVNCAGTGRHGSFERQSEEDVTEMLRLNIDALTRLTQICLPYMRKGSRILQFSSGAAFVPQADFAVYAASKAYVYSYSRALYKELKRRGIYVTTVCPGPVKTPFLEKAYKNGEPISRLKQKTMVNAKTVAAQAIKDCANKKAVSICGLPMKLLYWGTQGISEILSSFAG